MFLTLCTWYRSAASEAVTVETLVSELKSSSQWSESCVAVIRHIWKEEGPTLCSKSKETLSVGQVRSVAICDGSNNHIFISLSPSAGVNGLATRDGHEFLILSLPQLTLRHSAAECSWSFWIPTTEDITDDCIRVSGNWCESHLDLLFFFLSTELCKSTEGYG